MESIKMPILFSRDIQENLNETLQQKTGCFLFLKTDEILPGFQPASYEDAFLEIVVGLYIVYHDYACQFWKVFVDRDFCPNGISPGELNNLRVNSSSNS